jgi:hypothetical protein
MSDPADPAEPERPDRCETCRFWKRLCPGELYPDEGNLLLSDEEDDLVIVGSCHRYPPLLDSMSRQEMARERKHKTGYANDDHETYHLWTASLFPVTDYWDWCGEWQARPRAEGDDP